MRDLSVMEKQVLKLLQEHANSDYSKNDLAPWIAKTSLQLGHLYSDLGLSTQLSHIENHKFLYKKASLNPINRHF
jgi:nitrogen fixation protein NifQ